MNLDAPGSRYTVFKVFHITNNRPASVARGSEFGLISQLWPLSGPHPWLLRRFQQRNINLHIPIQSPSRPSTIHSPTTYWITVRGFWACVSGSRTGASLGNSMIWLLIIHLVIVRCWTRSKHVWALRQSQGFYQIFLSIPFSNTSCLGRVR